MQWKSSKTSVPNFKATSNAKKANKGFLKVCTTFNLTDSRRATLNVNTAGKTIYKAGVTFNVKTEDGEFLRVVGATIIVKTAGKILTQIASFMPCKSSRKKIQ